MAEDFAIKIENLKKQYRLGAIGGGTLTGDLQSWWARKRGKEDPNLKIGQDYSNSGERFLALDGINITIKKGEAVGIIGANGAGKSTLLKILSRVTAPTEGDIWINGRISSMLEVGTGFHPEMTGRENIYMNGAILGMTRKEVDAKIESIIDFSECRQFIDTPVKRYSSGMYVKLAFAVASHLDSEIMVMDEVLAVGDMKFQKKCLGKMGDAAHNEKKTVLYVSHNMATIRNLCDRCIVLSHGKVIFDGDVEEAIDIYLDKKEIKTNTRYQLDDCERERFDYGKDFKFLNVSFLDKNAPTYFDGDALKFEISYYSMKEIKDVSMFIHLYSNDTGTVVSLITSKTFDVIKGTQNVKFEANIDMLCNGNYFFEVGAMQRLIGGDHVTLDRPKCKIYFTIEKNDENNMKWVPKIYGNVIFPEMRAIL